MISLFAFYSRLSPRFLILSPQVEQVTWPAMHGTFLPSPLNDMKHRSTALCRYVYVYHRIRRRLIEIPHPPSNNPREEQVTYTEYVSTHCASSRAYLRDGNKTDYYVLHCPIRDSKDNISGYTTDENILTDAPEREREPTLCERPSIVVDTYMDIYAWWVYVF